MIPLLEDPSWIPEVIVLGKGPSASEREKYLLRFPHAILVTLNHAVRWADKRKRVWAHFVDKEAMNDCLPELMEGSATRLLVPSVMNENSHRSRERVDALPIPGFLYDRDQAGLRFFSAEGAVGALGIMDHRKVLLIGVDGGTGYAPGLADVKDRERRGSGRSSYDAQWAQLDLIVARFGMEVYRAPLG